MSRPGEKVTVHKTTYGWDEQGAFRVRTLVHVLDCGCTECWEKGRRKDLKR